MTEITGAGDMPDVVMTDGISPFTVREQQLF